MVTKEKTLKKKAVPNLQRPKPLFLRLNKEEKLFVKQQAKAEGKISMAKWVRCKVFGYPFTQTPTGAKPESNNVEGEATKATP
jgi:hypothetical protein